MNSRARNPSTVVKQADQTKTTDITYADDSELVIAMQANQTYHLTALIFIKSHADADFKWKLAIPSGATAVRHTGAYTGATALGTTADATSGVSPATLDTVQALLIEAIIITGATSGNLSIQWAQGTSDANATIVKQGSSLSLFRTS